MDNVEKLDVLLRHKELVNDSATRLGRKLVQQGEIKLGLDLIAAGFEHDNSKFSGIEWEALTGETTDDTKLAIAVRHHNHTNQHHPEAWTSIHEMPRHFIAEMVCDWQARCTAFGTSLLDWINGEAQERYGFTKDDPIYEKIMFFVNLLCDKPFKRIGTKAKRPRPVKTP